jgi:hypothetical protein
VTNLEAASFSAKGDGKTDDTSALAAAMDAFCNELASGPSSLHFPAGQYISETAFSPPSGWSGGRGAIFGDGATATEFLFKNPTNGFDFGLSVGPYPFLNAMEIRDLGIMAGAACGLPINLDYGTANGTAAETNRGCSVKGVSIGVLLKGEYAQVTLGAGWTGGPRFNVCCHLTLEDLFIYGAGNLATETVPTSGPGSGNAMQFLSCVNGQYDNITLAQWNLPILLGNAGNGLTDCQGLMFTKIRGVGMGSLFKMIGTQSQFPNGLAGCSVNDYMLDNGYSGDFYQGGIDVEYGSDIKIDGGWMQSGSNNSAPMLRLSGCTGIRVAKSKKYCGYDLPVVLITNGNASSFIEDGNTIYGSQIALQIDKGCPTNKIECQGIGVSAAGINPIVNNEPSTIFT